MTSRIRFHGYSTLKAIYQFVKQAAEQKWTSRLIRKSTIETALSDHNAALDDAARAFQVRPTPEICALRQ